MAQQMDVEEVLECTICLDVPASPIHQCSNGHIICGICADQVTKCGTCQSDLVVSILAERISRRMDFKSKCPNYESGCRSGIPSTEIKAHIPKCYYRNAECNEWHKEVCDFVQIPLKDFPRHLVEMHECTQLLTVTQTTTFYNKLEENSAWPLEITTKDGLFFLLHNYIKKDAIYFWMTVLADEAQAGTYLYEIILEKRLDNDGKKMTCCWTLPVLPYHDYPRFEEPSPLFVTVPEAVFYEFCKKTEVKQGTEYVLRMSSRIL